MPHCMQTRKEVLLVLHYLEEKKFTETMHQLEQESGLYFNMKYFEEIVLNGNWDKVEKYLGGFMNVGDNKYSMAMFFRTRKQKYLEALDKPDKTEAIEILNRELKVFATTHKDIFWELTRLLTLENFRKHKELAKYTDASSARARELVDLKKLIELNPALRDNLRFPIRTNSVLAEFMRNPSLCSYASSRNQTVNRHFSVVRRDLLLYVLGRL